MNNARPNGSGEWTDHFDTNHQWGVSGHDWALPNHANTLIRSKSTNVFGSSTMGEGEGKQVGGTCVARRQSFFKPYVEL